MPATNSPHGMNQHFRKVYETFAAGVAFVAVRDAQGNESIGSAFHVGEGVFVTARHVVDGMKIMSLATTVDSTRPIAGQDGAHEIVHHRASGRVVRGPFFHPNDSVDVAALIVEGIDAPTISLGGHLDDWLENEFVLWPALILGYPPIPFSKKPLLIAAIGEVNAVVDKYTGGHPHFVLSTMARGGFSGGPALTEHGLALGLVTEALGRGDQPAELGYLAVLSVEPIYVCLAHHKIMPPAIHAEWGEGDADKSFWKR